MKKGNRNNRLIKVKTKILMVDDDSILTNLFKNFLTSEGYDITVINNSSMTIQMANSIRPDLITLDLMMPPPGGLELCKKLRADTDFDKIPIIIITAVNSDHGRAYGAGANDYLTKPFDLDELVQRIEKVLCEKRLGLYD